MSPFTALFESLHSAWIDEIIERHPDPKPILEMPVRMNELKLPLLEFEQVGWVEVELGDRKAVIVLAHQVHAIEDLGLSVRDLWEKMLTRAGAEFLRRNINPRVGKFDLAQGLLSEAYPLPITRLIWVGAKLKNGVCYYGMAA